MGIQLWFASGGNHFAKISCAELAAQDLSYSLRTFKGAARFIDVVVKGILYIHASK